MTQDYQFEIFAPDDQHRGGADRIKKHLISTDTVRENLNHFTSELGEIINNLKMTLDTYELDEVTVQASITAEGQLSFLGAGLKGGANSTIALKYKKKQNHVENFEPAPLKEDS